MAARFEIGDPAQPRGHALLFFRTTEGTLLATYVVVLPIAISPARYMPPAFAMQIPAQMASVSATALPPIPEEMESEAQVRRLAEVRGDDLLDGGVVTADPERLMMAAHEAANDYAERYKQMVDALPPLDTPKPAASEPGGPTDEDELRWVLLEERERIGELAKLTGQLRYALEGGDTSMLRATVQKIERLGRLLPEKYRISEFLIAAQRPGDAGRRLAELYIDRCYKLSNEQYETLADIDRQIEALEGR